MKRRGTMGQFQLKDSPEGTILFAQGSLTIEHACSFKEILIEALEKTDHLIIDVQKITSIDLAGIQVLCAAHKTFREHHKDMEILGASTAIINKTIIDSAVDRSACGMEFHST